MKKITLLLVVLFNNAFSQSVSNVSVLSVTPTTAVIGYYANITGATNPMVAQGYYYIVSTNTIVSTGTNYYIPPNHNAATQLSFPVNSLSPSTDYRYVVQIVDTVTGFTNQTRPEVIFTTLANPVAPTISSVSSASVTDSGATINYTVNPNGAATTPIIRYGLSASALTSTQNCAVVSAGYTNVAQTQVLSGLAPSTTYHYRVEASNSVGSTPTGGPVSTFTTLATPALIYHWEFNNNLNATVGSVPFSAVNVGGTPPTYANSNTALVGASRQWFANLPAIPVGRTPRTIAMKVIIPTGGLGVDASGMFATGTNETDLPFSAAYRGANPQFQYTFPGGFVNFTAATNSLTAGSTHTFVFTYDGTNGAVYQNGTLLSSGSFPGSSTGTFFTIGSTSSTFNRSLFIFDDLKIYNYALNQAQVNALGNQDFNANNLKFSLYPNPATNLVNIELASELKSVEIYSLLGQKVLTSNKNQVDVSSLSKGIYLVRVEDVENSVSTQKLVVE